MIDFFAVSSVVIRGISFLAFWAGTRAGHSTAEASIDWLRAELRQANDRLYAASREPGVLIPPRELEPVPAIELPAELERLISDWESTETQEQLRAQFISEIGAGYSPADIKRRHLES